MNLEFGATHQAHKIEDTEVSQFEKTDQENKEETPCKHKTDISDGTKQDNDIES